MKGGFRGGEAFEARMIQVEGYGEVESADFFMRGRVVGDNDGTIEPNNSDDVSEPL